MYLLREKRAEKKEGERGQMKADEERGSKNEDRGTLAEERGATSDERER